MLFEGDTIGVPLITLLISILFFIKGHEMRAVPRLACSLHGVFLTGIMVLAYAVSSLKAFGDHWLPILWTLLGFCVVSIAISFCWYKGPRLLFLFYVPMAGAFLWVWIIATMTFTDNWL